jgi:hypothetical protein
VLHDLTYVSVPTEDIKHALKGSSTFMPTHASSGPALVCPIMPIMDQYFPTHFKSYKLLTNNQNFINNKEGIHNPNISTKATNSKIRSSTTK